MSTAKITVPASNMLRNDFSGSINITDDRINELSQVFLLLVETDQDTSVNPEAPVIVFPNDGLSIAQIVDDDSEFSLSSLSPSLPLSASLT